MRQTQASGAAAPEITGDVLFGSGDDRLEILAGKFNGAMEFGAGADTLVIDGSAQVAGALRDADGRLGLDLRNGRLNQTAYALYLFIRDIAEGDLIGWLDQRLQAANTPAGPDRLARMRDAVIGPLRQIHGVSDKVLTMALSSLLLGVSTPE